MENKKTVLVVDDEPKIIEVVASYLESKGYAVVTAETGAQALEACRRQLVALVLLDLMLPDISGEQVCIELRQQSAVPVIMLTAKAEEEDLLRGLGIGADDYITKPFSLRTLAARMEAVLRRAAPAPADRESGSVLQAGALEIDPDQHAVTRDGKTVGLTPVECRLLATLARHPSKVFTRDELIAAAFGREYDGFDRTVDSHIKNLRRKVEPDPRNPVYVKTVRGVGYKFGGGRR